MFFEDKAIWSVVDCESFQESISMKQKRSTDDKNLKMAVVNLLLMIFKCERSEGGSLEYASIECKTQ